MNKGIGHYIEYAIYYIIIFFILRQWLIPVMELTNTGRFHLFSYFIVLCLVIYLLNLPFVVSWVLKIGYICWFVVHVYSDVPTWSREGLGFLIEEIRMNTTVLMQMDWAYVTDPFRTVLFFVLIWMLLYLIHHWIHVRMTIFYFLVLTIFFIATLDTFSIYDGSRAVVEIVVLGLIMTSMLFIKRLVLSTGKVIEWRYYIGYMLPAFFFVLLFSSFAFLLPKAEPQWSDPVPFVKSMAGKATGTGTTTVGYSEDDSELGGPFSPNDDIVFTIKSKKKQYWRIETREIYTSRGWETYDTPTFSRFALNTQIPHSLNIGKLDATLEVKITPYAYYNLMLQPYGMISYNSALDSSIQLIQNTLTEKITPDVEGELQEYSVSYSEPTYSYTALKASKVENTPVATQYLQLPETLPQRVRDLAVQLTANQVSAYDKARMIQTYFGRSGFRYETRDVPIPTEGKDYVDQFLFETKYGYCDNFSTSMVVMLRAIDIPARWVKGFTGGTEIRSDEVGFRQYEITNNNAHSWVEAYIDGVGWMPFEPTIGYTNPANIMYDATAENESDPKVLEQQIKEREEQEQKKKEEEKVAQQQVKSSEFSLSLPVKRILVGSILLLAVIVAWLYRKRSKWVPKVYVQMQKNTTMDEVTFEKAYERLLKQLANVGLKRKADQTLQSFAKEIDDYYETDHMKRLTDAYERVIYSKSKDAIDYPKMKESWEYLINRTMS